MIDLCKTQGALTPYYYYDMELLGRTLDALRKAAPEPEYRVHYAMKANPNTAILAATAAAGLGIDAVSGGEIRRALAAGVKPRDIVYAGVGKTDAEIELGLQEGIGAFNVESIEELEVIAEIACRMGKKAPVALRVNPDIDAHSHHYITTGLAENKFGIAMERLADALAYVADKPSLHLRGLHFHIGSQILDFEPYSLLCERINALQDEYGAMGYKFQTINVGGGLGIDYDDPDKHPVPDFKAYFDVFRKNLNLRPGQELHFELGRAIVAQCGSLITKVLYVKKGLEKEFIIVDTGMNDLLRPALYGAHHLIQNLTSESQEHAVYDIVGPVCESSDVFAAKERLPLTHRSDILAIRSAGAYGEAMASTYNCRGLIKGFAVE